MLRPNQSLKLTEPAVDDLTRAKQPATIRQDLSRADWIPSLRSVRAQRILQLLKMQKEALFCILVKNLFNKGIHLWLSHEKKDCTLILQ